MKNVLKGDLVVQAGEVAAYDYEEITGSVYVRENAKLSLPNAQTGKTDGRRSNQDHVGPVRQCGVRGILCGVPRKTHHTRPAAPNKAGEAAKNMRIKLGFLGD
jgi:hypothetical protein